jgi:hypothetical protein
MWTESITLDMTWGGSLLTSGDGSARSCWGATETALWFASPRREELESKGEM